MSDEALAAKVRAMRSDDEIVGELALLEYPGFAYYAKRGQESCDPAELLLDAIDRPDLDARTVEGLPWDSVTFPRSPVGLVDL